MAISDRMAAGYVALLEASTLLFNEVDRQLRVIGKVSQTQWEIVVRLHDAPDGLRMTDLAASLVSSPSGLTYQADQLEQRGLITRARSTAGDDRYVIARLSPAGHEVYQRLMPMHKALISRHFMDVLSDEEFDLLATALSKVAASVKATREPRRRSG